MLRKGTFKFNQDANFNFQLNRVVLWGNGDPKEIAGVAKTITDSKSWVKAMIGLAEKAEREGRTEAQVGYLRILGVTYNTVKKLANEGVFESFYLQKRLFIKRDSFDDWLHNTGGKDPIIEQEKTGMWEPGPEPEKETKDLPENGETKASAEMETAAEGPPEKKEADPAIKQGTGSTSEQPVKIEPWCYSVEEAARILGVAKGSMYEVIRKNNIHHVYVGRRILLPKKHFHDWLEKAFSEPGKNLTR